MGDYSVNNMDMTKVAEYMNSELKKGRTQKDIEINDFGVNEKVIKNRLDRKGYKKINNQWVLEHEQLINTTNKTTEIIQEKKAFNNDEVEKMEKLLTLDINILNQMINEYTTKQTTSSSIRIKDTTTTVTSLRLNQSIYSLIKETAQIEGIGISEMINKCMLDYLNK